MKRIILAIIFLLLIAPCGYGQTPQQPLMLTIKTDKQIFNKGEAINIIATIRNEGSEIAKIYSPEYWGVSEIIVKNSQGTFVNPEGLKIERVAFDSFMTIPPNESRTYTFENLQWFQSGHRFHLV